MTKQTKKERIGLLRDKAQQAITDFKESKITRSQREAILCEAYTAITEIGEE